MPETDATLQWKNVLRLNRREKFHKWWRETFHPNAGTYMSPREHLMPFATSISVHELDRVASDGLRSALLKQKEALDNNESMRPIPLATEDGEFKGMIYVHVGSMFPEDENN